MIAATRRDDVAPRIMQHVADAGRTVGRDALARSQDRLVDLLPMHGHLDRRGDSEANLVAPDVHDGDHDVVADDDGFVSVAAKD